MEIGRRGDSRRPGPDSLVGQRGQLEHAPQLPDGRVECRPMSAVGFVTEVWNHFQVVSEETDNRGNKRYTRRKLSAQYLNEIFESRAMAQLL